MTLPDDPVFVPVPLIEPAQFYAFATHSVDLPDGRLAAVTVLAQVMHRPAVVAVSEPVDASPRRCGVKRTPNGVVSCYHDAGHVGAHSWEPMA